MADPAPTTSDRQVCIDHGWYRSDGTPCPECADPTTSDRLEEIRENGRSFGGGPDRSEWEWLIRLADAADELARAIEGGATTDNLIDWMRDWQGALAAYQEVRRG